MTRALLLPALLLPLLAGHGRAASSPPTIYTIAADQGAGPTLSITEWNLPTPNAMPRDTFVSKRDGFVWYSADSLNMLGRLNTKTGTFEEFHLRPGSDPYAVVEHAGSGVQSTVYFSSRTGGFIGEFDPNTREVREFRVRDGNAILHDLTFDRNGVVWFTVMKAQSPEHPQGSRVGSINLFSSEIRLAETPTRNASPHSLAVSRKGTPFFTELDSPRLGSVDPVTMKVTEYPLPDSKSGVRGLAITPDDQIWYTDHGRGYIGRFDPKTRKFQEWRSPGGSNSHPSAMTNADGMLWYLEAGPNPKLVRFNPDTQQFQTWALKTGGELEHLYAHPDGSLWFTLPSGNRITKVTVETEAKRSRIYVLNNKGTTVDVIDPATNQVVQRIEGIPDAHGATFSPDGSRAYITSESENALFEIDTKSGKVLRKVEMSEGTANVPTITKDGSRVFVCVNGVRDAYGIMQSQRGGFVDIVDTKSFQKVKSVHRKGGMHDCYTTPDGKYIIASSLGGKFLEVWDVKTDQPVWEVSFDKGVTTTAQEIGPDGSTRRLFSNLSDFRGFAVIDFAAHREVARIQLPAGPSGVLLGEKLSRRNHIPTHGNEVSPDGKTLWVVSRGANGVFVYSLPELKVIKFIPTPRVKDAPENANGADPGWIAFTHDGKTAYVANAAANSVSAIDANTMDVVAEIPVGEQPDHVFTLVLPDDKPSAAANPVRGKQLFDYTCDACHYANSTAARAGPGLARLYERKVLPNAAAVTDANVERFIRDGSSLMPGYRDKISAEQMRDLIAYLRSL
jgi:YVTN family beta-propeller protein